LRHNGRVAAETDTRFWLKLYAAAGLLYALMAWSAGALGSVRGEYGLIVGALVLSATLLLDRVLFAPSFARSVRELGLLAPRATGLIAAAIICALLVAVLPIAGALTGVRLSLRSDWLWLIPGLLAQAGLAEELVFRGLVFGRIRNGRTFWRAVVLSLPPFALVHMVLFFTMPWPIAAASLALSLIVTPPLCQLYELGGRTIWAPALVHAAIQGAIKLVDMDGANVSALPLIWIGACAAIPYLAFLWRRDDQAAVAASTSSA
jgi:membrane protease YdiL (CAAX protease family)